MKDLDPIIKEIRTFREALAKEHGYDVEKIAEAIDKAQAGKDQKLESRPPKRIAKKAS